MSGISTRSNDHAGKVNARPFGAKTSSPSGWIPITEPHRRFGRAVAAQRPSRELRADIVDTMGAGVAATCAVEEPSVDSSLLHLDRTNGRRHDRKQPPCRHGLEMPTPLRIGGQSVGCQIDCEMFSVKLIAAQQ
jgi:hypothetical protein